MSLVTYEDNHISLQDGESVLEGLTRNGHLIPNGCRAGACQACIMVAEDGDVPASAQAGLTAAQQKLNYFLSCQCRPATPLKVAGVSRKKEQVVGTISEKFWLNDHVICLRLKADIKYYPGQYVTLWKDENLARSYSIASVPSENNYLEFHIKKYPDGQFSSWLAETAEPGDELTIQGPLGHCFYSAEEHQPLLMVAISTGLAPIYGVLRDALAKGHEAPIKVVVGAVQAQSHYLVDELLALAERFTQLSVYFLALEDGEDPIIKADIYKFCATVYSNLNGCKIYLCGAQSFVNKMRKQCFLNGAKMSDIAADSFIPFVA